MCFLERTTSEIGDHLRPAMKKKDQRPWFAEVHMLAHANQLHFGTDLGSASHDGGGSHALEKKSQTLERFGPSAAKRLYVIYIYIHMILYIEL